MNPLGLLHRCPGVWWPCLIDNLAHQILRTNVRIEQYAGPLCRWHDDSVDRRYLLDLHHDPDVPDVYTREAIDWYVTDRAHRRMIVERATRTRKARRWLGR